MRRRTVLLFFTAVLVLAALAEADNSREECRRKVAACNLDSTKESPVCGTDGLTYPNHCRLISKQCNGAFVAMRHAGPCAETPPCFQARLTGGSKHSCRPDGTFAPTQCHDLTGYCWCVTPQGRPVPNTSVRGGRPRCNRAMLALAAGHSDEVAASAAVNSYRPASNRGGAGGQRKRKRKNGAQKRQYSGNRHKNNCDSADKAKFNGNLIDNFKKEYKRTNISNEGGDSRSDSTERVVSWKFQSLDKDSDGYLNRSEYKELRKLAKKAVKPRKCARTFARTCDLDQDQKLSRSEWGACLANDFTPDPPVVTRAHRTRATDFVLKGTSSNQEHQQPTIVDESPDDTDANDCISDRKSVMEDQRQNSSEKFYLPACTPDGRYHKIQCYSGYCFCVHQDTGKPIPGTSTKDMTPNCDPVPTPARPMKGCPEDKKQQFLRDLMDLMLKKMQASSSDSDEAPDNWQASKEERVATWHFVMLDKNKNKVLERKEWKSFRTMVSNSRQLRRCGKKLPRYCDINNDRKISMTEWLSCLNATRPQPQPQSNTAEESSTTQKPVTTETKKRKGQNPIDQFLNAD